jgi:A/G-specific adenine glycosylase
VARVFARVFAVEVAVDGTEGQRRLWNLAETLVPAADPSSHNQALMELGALVCSPRDPACGECPLSDRCRAFALGTPTAYPVKKKKTGPQPVLAVAGLLTWPCVSRTTVGGDHGQSQILVPSTARAVGREASEASERSPVTSPSHDGDLVLFAQRPEGLLGGLWELPGGEVDDVSDSESASTERLAEVFQARTGIEVNVGERLATVMHQFTHRTLTLHIHRVSSVAKLSAMAAASTPEVANAKQAVVPDATPTEQYYTAMRWLSPETVGVEVALSTLTRKVLAAVRGTIETPSKAKRPRRTRAPKSLELPL